MVKLLLVDDHSLVRTGLCYLLKGMAGFQVVGEVGSGEEALSFCRGKQASVDVVLMDLELPGWSGLVTAMKLKQFAPEISVVILTMHAEASLARKVLQSGISCFLSKNAKPDEVIKAVQLAAQGGRYIPPNLAQSLILGDFYKSEESVLSTLSTREHQVFEKLVRGSSNEEMARSLCLSPKTINTHRSRIFRKLGVKNYVELVQFALKSGLIPEKVF